MKNLRFNNLLATLISLLMFIAGPALANDQQESPRKILILGASISWGCVNTCKAVQSQDGYVERLRLMLPDDEIRVAAWFASGIADWSPSSVSILDQSLVFPVGVWEEDLGHKENLWSLMAVPQICSWKPDYVVIMAGLGDVLRVLRKPPLDVTSQEEYLEGVIQIEEAIHSSGAHPVLTVDPPFGSLINAVTLILEGYRDSIHQVCEDQNIRCGPNMLEVVDPIGHFVGTDHVHPNVAGHQALAEAFADWFQSEPTKRMSKSKNRKFCQQHEKGLDK